MNSAETSETQGQQPSDDDFLYELLAEMRLPEPSPSTLVSGSRQYRHNHGPTPQASAVSAYLLFYYLEYTTNLLKHKKFAVKFSSNPLHRGQ